MINTDLLFSQRFGDLLNHIPKPQKDSRQKHSWFELLWNVFEYFHLKKNDRKFLVRQIDNSDRRGKKTRIQIHQTSNYIAKIPVYHWELGISNSEHKFNLHSIANFWYLRFSLVRSYIRAFGRSFILHVNILIETFLKITKIAMFPIQWGRVNKWFAPITVWNETKKKLQPKEWCKTQLHTK